MTRKKRGRGEGSIYRRKDGRWVGQYVVQTENGKKTRWIYGKTRQAVAEKLARAIAERDAGLVFDAGGLKVGEYLDRWLGTVRDTVRERTWKRHEEIVRLHLKPPLGRGRLDRLNPLQIQSLYRTKMDSGLSNRTVQIIHSTLHKALEQAVRWQLIPRNAAGAVYPPKPKKSEIKPLDKTQVKTLLKAVEGERFYALDVLAVTTGMRQGEMLGLKWDDVDLVEGTLRVRRTVFNGIVNAPKTSKSRRRIKLTRAATRALRDLEGHGRGSEWVFSTTAGTPVSVHNLHNRSWKPLLKKAGLPNIRFHDLRHTCATLLLSKRVHPKIVQELLGHSSISMTLDTYSHVLPGVGDEAAGAMEDLF